MNGSRYPNATAKLARADRHIADIRAMIDAYEGAYLIPNKVDFLFTDWTVMLTHQVPEVEIQSALGDAVHNLRTTLDVLAVAIVREAGGNPRGVYFPFCEKAEDLDQMIRRRNFHRAPSAAVALLKEIKPYKAGNEALRAIHDLDIRDKHNDLIPTFSGGISQGDIITGNNIVLSQGFVFELFDGFCPIRALTYLSEQPISLKLEAAFGKGLPFQNNRIVPQLQSLSELVDSIIEAFSAL